MRKSLEYIDDVQLTAASTDFFLTNGLPNDYMTWGLYVEVSFRDVVGTAAAASVIFGSPTSFIERFEVSGNMLGKGRIAVIDLSGRQMFQYARFMRGVPSYVDSDNFVVGAGAVATYDIRIGYILPFVALGSIAAERATLLPANMFSNPLQVRIRRGGAESIAVNAGTTTQTFTAYGSGAGNPVASVSRIVIKEGLGEPQRAPLLCQKLRQGPFPLTANLTNGLVGRLNTGNLIGRIHMQVGVAEQDAGQSGELASGSFANLARLYLKQNANFIRNVRPRDQMVQAALERGLNLYGDATMLAQGIAGQTTGILLGERAGEFLFDFCPDGNLDDALNTVLWAQRGQNLLINADATGLANQQLEVLTEEYSAI